MLQLKNVTEKVLKIFYSKFFLFIRQNGPKLEFIAHVCVCVCEFFFHRDISVIPSHGRTEDLFVFQSLPEIMPNFELSFNFMGTSDS